MSFGAGMDPKELWNAYGEALIAALRFSTRSPE